MRIVFMGTPNFAATILEDLSQHYNVVARTRVPMRFADGAKSSSHLP